MEYSLAQTLLKFSEDFSREEVYKALFPLLNENGSINKEIRLYQDAFKEFNKCLPAGYKGKRKFEQEIGVDLFQLNQVRLIELVEERNPLIDNPFIGKAKEMKLSTFKAIVKDFFKDASSNELGFKTLEFDKEEYGEYGTTYDTSVFVSLTPTGVFFLSSNKGLTFAQLQARLIDSKLRSYPLRWNDLNSKDMTPVIKDGLTQYFS